MAGKRLWLALAFAALGFLEGCRHDRPPPTLTAATEPDPLAPLRGFEEARRRDAHFLDAPASDGTFGSDPYDLVTLPGAARAVGILRGRDQVVLLDVSGRAPVEVASVPAPRGPSAIALAADAILVASEHEPLLARYRVAGDRLERLADLPLEGVHGVRDVAVCDDGSIHVVSEHDDRLVTLAGGHRSDRALPPAPIRVLCTKHELFVLSAVDHSLTLFPRDPKGSGDARLAIDGPLWGFDAIDVDGGTLVVATGAEDHPLDRREGFFGYVDSFVYGWFLAKETRSFVRTFALNASERGVVVPKAIAFASRHEARVAAYGSAHTLTLTWRDDASATPAITVGDAPPGTSALAFANGRAIAANPLLDAWVALDGGAVTPADRDVRDPRTRIGEALFFTDLMAPANSSAGALSRFTCETCHFEGYVDGRTHHTGRGDVHATTKPLLGLFNNRPHFSRALDPDLSAVAENEFRVAGAHSDTDPHFTASVAKTPWLAHLGTGRTEWDATELRLSLMSFLMAWSPRTNPMVTQRHAFTDEERRGAELFRDRCEGCHQARASADDASSRVAFADWERLVFSDNGPLVWASDAYEKTGVEPYVHEKGARVPSLRRLYKKRPYFTNGSAKTVLDVIVRARFTPFAHAGRSEGERVDERDARAIAAFLDLL